MKLLIFLVGGLARLDILTGPEHPKYSKQNLILTLFASEELPIFVERTSKVDEFYAKSLREGVLKVPDPDPERLKDFPELAGEILQVYGVSNEESGCDIGKYLIKSN